jgi:hypothetical protein
MTSPSELSLEYYAEALESTQAALKSEMKRSASAEAMLAAVREAVSDTETYGVDRCDDAGRLANHIRSLLAENDQ